jgi:hypothetical protein
MVKDKEKNGFLVPCKFLSSYALKIILLKIPTFHKISVLAKSFCRMDGCRKRVCNEVMVTKKIHISNQPSCVQLLPNAHG